ncbi:MAG: hypothetical protein U0992_19065 [Planctomycetaceae bacterium]
MKVRSGSRSRCAAWTAPDAAALSAMGIGSWPWSPQVLAAAAALCRARYPMHFQAIADLAVADVIAAQERAGVDVVTDGEQRRDSYASFIGNRLENCQLVPIVDLLPYVEEPDKFRDELRRARCARRDCPPSRRVREACTSESYRRP